MILNLQDLLKKDIYGKVIVFETDTVYGLGCLYNDLESVKRIYEIKRREPKKPMALLCANRSQVMPLVTDFSTGERLAEKYWPGALTIIFPKSPLIDDLITSGGMTVGVRIPSNHTAQSILSQFGPMVVTSLNLSNEPAILKFSEAAAYDGIVDYIVKGKDLEGIASTVYDPVNKKTLRQGSVFIE
jgi:L-threonylcarbamoyladenylate synthase